MNKQKKKDVGRLPPPLEESHTGSEVSEWELRGRREREEERKAQVLGAEGELGGGGSPVVPTHPHVHGIGRGGMRLGSAFSFVISLVRIIYSWELATSRHRADSGRETGQNVCRHSLDKLNASMINPLKN